MLGLDRVWFESGLDRVGFRLEPGRVESSRDVNGQIEISIPSLSY